MNGQTAPPRLRCWAEIDLAALERNLKAVRAALPRHIRYVAVVKADAYGHGMAPAVRRLMHSGADLFAVANLEEAREIREIGSGWPILLLSPLLPEETEAVRELDVMPTLSSLEEVERFARLGPQPGKPIQAHLKIDTGMGRAGVWHTQAERLYAAIQNTPALQLAGIYTHFSSADTDTPYTLQQRERFLSALQRLPQLDTRGLLIHADNSAGLETFPRHGLLNGVRIGLLQFGVVPHPASLLSGVDVAPVFSLHTRVGLIKDLPAGAPVSYGRTYTLKRDSRIAVITAGYGDCLPTRLSNTGKVLVKGQLCPIIGRVTMDQTIIDVTDCPVIETGEPVCLIGQQGERRISLEEFGQWSGQIPWEILVTVTKRVRRIYKTDTAL